MPSFQRFTELCIIIAAFAIPSMLAADHAQHLTNEQSTVTYLVSLSIMILHQIPLMVITALLGYHAYRRKRK